MILTPKRAKNTKPSKREAVLIEFERLHKANLSFGIKDVTAAVGLARSIISVYCADYVRTVADRMLDEEVGDDVDFERWRTEFLTLRSFFNNTTRRDELFSKWFRIHIEHLHRAEVRPTVSAVRRISGGLAKSIRIELTKWSKETGAEVKAPWVPNRPVILAEFERMHKARVPFLQKDVADAVGVSGTLISMYCRGYVCTVADRMLEEHINNEEDFERWRTEFLTLRSFLNNTMRRDELFAKWIRAHIDHIHRAGRLPVYTEVRRISGSGDKGIRIALAKWSKDTGIPLSQGIVWKEVPLKDVLANVDRDLHHLPLTFLDKDGLSEPFNEAQRRMVANIVNPSLRNTAFFVMAFADRNRANDLAFFTQFDSMLTELGLVDFNGIDPDTFYSEYHSGHLLPLHSQGKRGRFLQSFFRLIRRQRDYLRKLTKKQRDLVLPFILRHVSDDHFWRQSTLLRSDDQRRVKERKADVAVVHSKFYQIREIVERRCQLVERLHDAFDRAVVVAKGGAKLPLKITLKEEVFRPGRTAERVTYNLLLWNGPSLRKAHIELGDRGYYDSRKGDDHPSNLEDQFYLSYDHIHEVDDSTNRYWFSGLISAGYGGSDEKLKRIGVSRHAFDGLPHSPVGLPLSGWLRVLRDHTDIELVPIDLCMSCALIGHAAIQIMTKTGARANEFLQIRIQREHLVRASLPNDSETIIFHAIPKGRTKEEPFYIDERCMKALFSWWKYRTSRGYVFDRVSATRGLRPKLQPASYLWQIGGRHLNHRDLNSSLDFLLFDVPLEKGDGSKVQLSSHLLRHSFATEMRALDTPIDVLAILMNQRDTSVTEYYSKPTPPMLAEFQRRIFETKLDLTRTHRRSAGQIARQVEEAMSKVGALAPVIGGRCTVANACPAAFACLGCFGNAPDAAKRGQVLEYQARYTEMAERAEVQNLPHERRKALDIVSNCSDMLAEMDCIEAADLAAEVPLAVAFVDREGRKL